ncbi:hypothetical protein [Chondromyces crocatus]|uniref:Protein kinase domain-containing protein n=1 Tax=Chondromyces crocatus TaxID=52 RepID=A0A0K1EI95_CHOCO|nr:hypothetical protein [Chondromyces crocatus]AKT40570.1 uncharacterized protein CMC5_047260 [Chondromyces crocatus]
MRGSTCRIDGSGEALVVRRVHVGERFEVLELEASGRRLALKIAAEHQQGMPPYRATRTVGTVSTIWSMISRAGILASSSWGALQLVDHGGRPGSDAREGTSQPGEVHETTTVTAEMLLTEEAQRIRDTEPHWNHQVLDLARCHLPDRAPALGLLMPWHPGVPLGTLPQRTQRRLLPRMMLSLWDALAAGLHGDLHDANVIVAPTEDRFALIDPGAMLLLPPPPSPGPTSDILTFVCSPTMYPLLPPYAITRPLAEGDTLHDHWHSFVRSLSWDDIAVPLDASGDSIHILPSRGRYLVQVPRTRGEPHPADLLAVGILYYRALTGAHPFFDARFTEPAWLSVMAWDSVISGDEPGRERVARPVVAPSERTLDDGRGSVLPEEEALALALLDLEVPSRDRLLSLSAAAAQALARADG